MSETVETPPPPATGEPSAPRADAGADPAAATPSPAVLDALLEEPFGFEFFQAVRLLQRTRGTGTEVGRFGDPQEEAVRFGVNPRLAFPASQIQDLTPGREPRAPWRMEVNMMGLVGHFGVLPHHYSLRVMERIRNRDRALPDFLDLFHHRMVSLFYRAWERYRFYAAWERGEEDGVTAHLRDLLGLGGPTFRPGPDLDETVLLGYLGLLGPQQRSAMALEQLVTDYFGVPAEVEQFVGGWYRMTPAQCRIDDEREEAANELGYGALVGDEVWDPHARARIVLGPLSRTDYDRFLPDGEAFDDLQAIARFFSDDRIEFELRLILDPDDVQPIALGDDDMTPLGWGTWLRSADRPMETAETILSL